MSMDPDGTNRIIKQQIKEWHAVVEDERIAKLLESERSGPRLSFKVLVEMTRARVVGRLSWLRHRRPEEPVAVMVAAAEPQPELGETLRP